MLFRDEAKGLVRAGAAHPSELGAGRETGDSGRCSGYSAPVPWYKRGTWRALSLSWSSSTDPLLLLADPGECTYVGDFASAAGPEAEEVSTAGWNVVS